jgi:hypothetical protein
LAAAIIRFDRNHDPEFLDRVLEEENLTEMENDMTYPQVSLRSAVGIEKIAVEMMTI